MSRKFSASMLVAVGFIINGQDALASISEIKSRYVFSQQKAREFCTGLSGKIDQVKIMAGISTAASGVGTLAAGTALVTGVMKANLDKSIAKNKSGVDTILEIRESGGITPENISKVRQALQEISDAKNELGTELSPEQKKSAKLGTVRTVGSFVAGGTSAASAVTSFIGMDQLDKLASDMDECSTAISEIKYHRAELEA
ncbi:MAG: hypothetical protein LBO78_03815, partial [Rickettsiales bacterium]|nr:hypothetical protein [Rickettsiales bacterium]